MTDRAAVGRFTLARRALHQATGIVDPVLGGVEDALVLGLATAATHQRGRTGSGGAGPRGAARLRRSW